MNRKILSFRESEKIGLLIENFRIMYHLLTELTSWGFKFKILNIDEPFPKDLSVIITGLGELNSTLYNKDIQIINISDEINDIITSLLLHIVEKKLFHQVVIGIDPGTSTGLAVIADGCILFAEVVTDDEIIQNTLELLNTFPGKNQIIKIGDGGVISDHFFNKLFSQIPQHVIVQKVDEAKSSSQLFSGSMVLNKDQSAAIRIARRSGTRITVPPKIKVSPGLIQEVQNLSRKLSKGRFTIPRTLAIRVCHGELSLTAAIKYFKHHINF